MEKKSNRFLLTALFFLLFTFCFAQNKETSASGVANLNAQNSDTSQLIKKSGIAVSAASKAAQVHSHSAKKAALFSTIVPGLGQVYNKKYWKIPIVYAGFGAMTYFFTFNNNRYNKFKTALILRNDDDESTVDEYATRFPNQASLIEFRDYYRRNRDLSAVGFILIYVLNIVDASVDGNLYYFDVSDDLTLQWSPVLIPSNTLASGISLKLKF